MRKKDLIALADVVREVNADECATPFTEYQIDMLADFCQSKNSNFKRDRWLAYIAGTCGPNGGKVKKAAQQ